tara:strand:- start:77 stop:928 length:852 start_codon:yes stop_codon:yes gene_type:complete
MAKYTNLKCGNCGYSFTGGYSPGNKSVLGPSRVKCPKCRIVNSTSSKPYSQFKFSDYLVFWTGRVISMLLLGSLYGGILGYVTGIGNAGIIIGIIGNTIYNYFNIKYQINETEKEEDEFITPEMDKERLKYVVLGKLSRVQNLDEKLKVAFPKYNPTKSYNEPVDRSILWEMQHEYSRDYEILTWPLSITRTDENNKVFFEQIALYVKKTERNRFVKDKLNFNGPVYIREELAFNQNGDPLLWGYFEHPKTKILLQQAKDHLSSGLKKPKPDTPYFVIWKIID